MALGEEGYLVDERTKGIKYYHCIWIAKDKIGQKVASELVTVIDHPNHLEKQRGCYNIDHEWNISQKAVLIENWILKMINVLSL